MKPHPRIRKTIKWGGAVVTVLLVVVWIGSGWCYFTWQSAGQLRAAVAEGRAGGTMVYDAKLRPPPGWSISPTPFSLDCRWKWERVGAPRAFAGVWFPLWEPLALAVLVAAVAWRLDALARRRARGGVNLCPKCNYDRAGLAAGAKCPECGSAAP